MSINLKLLLNRTQEFDKHLKQFLKSIRSIMRSFEELATNEHHPLLHSVIRETLPSG
jgi:hypothetical protein